MKKILLFAFAAMLAVGAVAQELANFSRGAQQIVSPEVNGCAPSQYSAGWRHWVVIGLWGYAATPENS